MGKFLSSGIALLALIILFAAACTPAAAPAPSPAPTPQLAPPAPAAPQARAPTPEEVAWQGVVKAAQKEGRVTIYGLALAGDVGRIVAEAFKKKYGVTLEILVSTGPALTERLQAEKRMGKHVGDLVQSGSVSSPRLVDLGLTQDVSRELPAIQNREMYSVSPVFSPDGHVLSYGYTPFATLINSNLVKPEEIQSYKDLLNPKWRKKIIVADPRLGSGAPMLTTVQYRMDKILDDDYFRRLSQQEPVMWPSSTEQVFMLGRGEVSIAFEVSYTSYLTALREGAPISVLFLKEGTIGMPNTVLAVNNAPHPNAAKLFLNWFLGAEGQALYHKAQGSSPIRKDVPDFIHPKAMEYPIKKLLPTTWTHTLQTIKEVREGVMEQIWGKR